MSDEIQVERLEGVALIRLNRPKALNALTTAMLDELLTLLAELGEDPAVGAVVVAGGPKVFGAGVDISALLAETPLQASTSPISLAFQTIGECAVPIVVAVGGLAVGGALELALASDIVVAADDAKFGLPETSIGAVPGGGATQRLVRAVGKSVAMDMLLSGRMLTADEALAAGLVSRVVPRAELDETAIGIAQAIAARSRVAVRLSKKAVTQAFETTLTAGLLLERALGSVVVASDDHAEGMQAFLEKRKPAFVGH